MSDVSFVRAVPVLPVHDFAAAAAFFRDKLGFTVAFHMGRYGGVEREGIMVHLDAFAPVAAPISARIDVKGIDALYAATDPAIVKPDEQLADLPHGLRQFSVLDPTGNRVTFAQPIG